MLANRWDTSWLGELILEIANKHIEELYTIKIEVLQAVEYLKSKMFELQSWAELFVSSQPKAEAIVKAGNGATATMCVSKLLDVEEHVWSPMYGLKGNIDATVQVTMKDGKQQQTLTVPFEVKTGKNSSAAHRAQTALYNLLMSDRYDIEVAYGILYYMETSETIRIPAIRHELRHMIMQRNELACFVRERHAQLPPMLRKENMCGRCYAKVPCFIYHKLADDGNGETSGMKEKFDEVVKHLTPKHKEFFLKWDNLLTKEEKESLKFRRELWTMLSSEREKLGRCFANVVIEEGSAFEDVNSPKINRYQYTMIKQSPPRGFSFIDSQIVVGEPIVISDEKGHFALANGYVTQVRKKRITVAVDRRLHNARIRRPGFDDTNNQVFASIMEVAPEGSTSAETSGKISEEPTLYRLDKDEFSNGMATVRNNLIQTMAEGPFGSREIRSLVVDLVAPRFKTQSTAYTLTDQANINVDQRKAIEKVMSAQDYALVLGMPGTGKTTTIAHIIRALVSQGKSVLLTSYTHTAVDNILLKLKDDEIRILRLGASAKVNPDVRQFAELAVTPKTSFDEIRSAWHNSPVVATTCLSINHPIFNERTFDYCIVDEASQITLPVCLGPIRMARTFILVGDHNQLPPLVQNEEARTGGLDISLFKHLSDTHPASVVYLEHQYRMCEDVMALSNNLIYNGRLKCGSQEVANSRITIPNIEGLQIHHHTPATIPHSQKSICSAPVRGRCWIRDLLDPDTKVSFVNTDTLLPEAREQAKGNRIVNPTEAAICVQLVESLLSVGVPASTIGVMTHYRSQLSLLKHGLRNHTDVEMHTADRFQGRDKEVIILSLVRSNEASSIGELLKDWRRINVAFTRAKTKLLVIGSRETLKGSENGSGNEEMVGKFVRLMEKKQWIYDLPKGALEDHYFDAAGTQVTTSSNSHVCKPPGTQWKSVDVQAPKKLDKILEDKRGKGRVGKHQPKRAQAGERAILQGRPVLANILAEVMGNS
ncbi:DNA replication ATP-dependent helicase/nuclease dna2 [Phlyctema vagabunda]|uniref:DNA replication ATP-dependent helicase/nuclease n=1 Tax=Phlyctema vagabunda TaxID=108571 RepID=A0ABR4PBN8_9HELO